MASKKKTFLHFPNQVSFCWNTSLLETYKLHTWLFLTSSVFHNLPVGLSRIETVSSTSSFKAAIKPFPQRSQFAQGNGLLTTTVTRYRNKNHSPNLSRNYTEILTNRSKSTKFCNSSFIKLSVFFYFVTPQT